MILFDIGWTLIGSTSDSLKIKLEAGLGIKEPYLSELKQFIYCYPAKTERELADAIADRFELPPKQCRIAVHDIWQCQLEATFVLSGAARLIAQCRELGLRRAYLSNAWQPFSECFTKHFPEESKEAQFFSFVHRLAKPNPAFFCIPLHDLATPATQTIMVGDNYHADIAPAIGLGMKTVWVLHRTEKEKTSILRVVNRLAPKPDQTMASIAELTAKQLQNLSNQ